VANESSVNTTSESKLVSGAWLVVALLFFVGSLNYLDRIIITTMRASLIESIPMTDVQFGLLTSVFLWVYGILSPLAGFLADRFNRSVVIIGSLFVWSTVTWLTAYATTFEQLLATRALMGISEACYIPAALALIADYHRGTTRSLANSINLAGVMAGSSLGFVGGWIAEKYDDWTIAFIILGAIGVVYSLVLVFFLRDPSKDKVSETSGEPDHKASFLQAMKDLFGQRAFILMLIFWALMGLVVWLIVGWLPTYYKEHFNLSQSVAGLYATGYLYPASFAGLLTGGLLADRWSRTNPRARILLPVIGLLIAAPFVFIASYVSVITIAILCFVVYAFTRMFIDANMMPVLCMIVNPRYRATGYGILNLVSCLIGGVGIYAGGALRDADVDLGIVFQSASLIMVFCAIMFYRVRPR
jgi:MFS family permease